jgi:hypothetical protein
LLFNFHQFEYKHTLTVASKKEERSRTTSERMGNQKRKWNGSLVSFFFFQLCDTKFISQTFFRLGMIFDL